jgi:regulatory protein
VAWSKKPRKPAAPLDADALYNYAVGALGRRMRTVAELKRLMRTKVEPTPEGDEKIAGVVARLKEYQLLNDTRYATEYTRLRQENQKFGQRRVRQDLMQRGVHGDIISTTLDTAYADKPEDQLALAYLRRKRIKPPRDEKQTARAARQLARAGFSTPAIFRALRLLKADADALAALEHEPPPDENDGA